MKTITAWLGWWGEVIGLSLVLGIVWLLTVTALIALFVGPIIAVMFVFNYLFL